MIPATHLRIGNWVNFSHIYKKQEMQRPCKVLSLGRAECIVQDGAYEISIPYNSDGIAPIPLSGEVLLACGFSYLKIEGVAGLDEDNPKREENTHNWTLNIKREGIYDGKGRLELVKWGDGPKEKIWFSDQWLRVEIKSLHQLMNLYFSLTGKELTYNPSKINSNGK